MLALRTTDPQLEDDARLAGGSRAVWRGVLWPRVRFAALAGAGWVAVQALTESAVTDVMMVRTFAEEVYFQLVGNPAGVSAAVAVTLPVWVGSAVVVTLVLRRIAGVEGEVRKRNAASSRSAAATVSLWFGVVVFVGIPVGALVLRVGEAGQFRRVASAHGFTLLDSLLWAAVAGIAAAALALGACWRGRNSRRWAVALLVLTAAAWVTPAPLAGLGLKTAIGGLVSAEDAILGPDSVFAPVRSLFYDQPSPLPGVWAHLLRFFPVAVVVLWPAVRSVPRELIDSATLDGGRRAAWRAAVWPCVRRAFGFAVVAVALLALGEVVSAKLVQPPGRHGFAQELFDAMHYGADSTVAAMCLLQVATLAVVSVMVLRCGRGL
jgi:iron(III) transport system permease protein